MNTPDKSANRILKLQVGFLFNEGLGFYREVPFDKPTSIKLGDIVITLLGGNLRLTRTTNGILIQGALNAQIPTECTRCLSPSTFDYTIEFSHLFNSPRPPDSEDPYFVDESGIIDLEPIVREESILALPLRELCKPDCKGLCSICGQDFNQGTCTCIEDQVDPRMAELRALLDD